MKKEFLSFALLTLYFMGAIGGVGYAFAFADAKIISISVIVLAVMAWPTAKKCFDNLLK